MTTAAAVLLLGSSLTAKGAAASRAVGPWACAGLASGADSMNPKRWACEDSVGLVPLEGGGVLACVADAHWGGKTAELVCQGLADAWGQARAADPAARLREALFLLDGRLLERGKDDRSETTALVVHVQGRALAWANVGDSLLLVVGREAAALKNQPTPVFMGGRPLATLPVPVEVGTATLAPGDVVLLATDGLEWQASGLDPEQVAVALRRDGPLLARVDGLLDHVNRRGRDNLGVVAVAV
ncbi:MAG: SpoIIE family protein phosphatase [Planctomycetes bacterium]|nr:SpoIIE family protein phosphatase [Planctomycetota bacterium]